MGILGVIDRPNNGSFDPPFTSREAHYMRQLNSDYEHHHAQIDDPVPGTCEWVLSHPTWQQWRSCLGSSLLWITSNPGCGKTVMAKFLVNYFHATQETGHNFGYFFFTEGISGQDNIPAALSSLLHQLYCSQRTLIKHATKKLDIAQGRISSNLSILWSILVDSIEDTTRDTLWVLDGLDECGLKSLRPFMKILSAYIDSRVATENQRCKGRFKVVLLSRPSSLIQQTLGLSAEKDAVRSNCDTKFRLCIEDENEALKADILLFAQRKISELAEASALPERALRRLRRKLIAGADFTFLWISLVVKIIEDATVNGISVVELDKILKRTSLDDLYMHLLRKASREFPQKTRKLLSIVLASVRPLTIDEMCVAVEVDEDCFAERVVPARHRSTNRSNGSKASEEVKFPRNWREQESLSPQSRAQTRGQSRVQSLEILGQYLHKPFDNHIRQLCGHFVRIRGRKIYFVHQTARSFLVNTSFHSRKPGHPLTVATDDETLDDIAKANNLDHAWWLITPDEANQTVLKICVNYIKLFESEIKACDEEQLDWNDEQISEHLVACKADPPRAFFPYAALHWFQHYRAVRKGLDFKYDKLLCPGTALFHVWIKVHRSWTSEHGTEKSMPGTIRIKNGINRGIPSLDLSRILSSEGEEAFESLVERMSDHLIWISRRSSIEGGISDDILRKLVTIADGMEKLREWQDMMLVRPLKETQEDQSPRLRHLKALHVLVDEIDEEKRLLFEDETRLEALTAKTKAKAKKEGDGFLKLKPPNTGMNEDLDEILMRFDELGFRIAERKGDLNEVLFHFDLLNLEELGLEGDQFLDEFWQSREDDQGVYGAIESEDEDYETYAGVNTPNWVKHYIRQQRESTIRQLDFVGNPESNVNRYRSQQTVGRKNGFNGIGKSAQIRDAGRC